MMVNFLLRSVWIVKKRKKSVKKYNFLHICLFDLQENMINKNLFSIIVENLLTIIFPQKIKGNEES